MLTRQPKQQPKIAHDAFVVLVEWANGFQAMWKTYSKFWSALRFGTDWIQDHPHCIVNLRTNEIVWQSWTDENKYKTN